MRCLLVPNCNYHVIVENIFRLKVCLVIGRGKFLRRALDFKSAIGFLNSSAAIIRL
jgi:hypothetical protein